jgi:hypothetical protein
MGIGGTSEPMRASLADVVLEVEDLATVLAFEEMHATSNPVTPESVEA